MVAAIEHLDAARAWIIARNSWRMLWRYRLRSALIMLAAALGVAGVTLSLAYSQAGREKVLSQLRRLGSNVITISPRAARAAGARAATGTLAVTLVPRDYNAIKRTVDGISAMSATSAGTYLIKAGDLSRNNAAVLGTEASYFRIRNWSFRDGTWFDEAEDRRAARVAVLGAVVARELFGNETPIGERLFIRRVPFQVIGVLTEFGQDLDGGDADNTVYVPLSTQMHRLSNLDHYTGITVSVTDWKDMNDVAADVDALLSRTHRAVGNDRVDYQILNQRTLVDSQIIASDRLERYVRMVGASALAVTGLGILAICWISVSERAGEIGLRRSLGATRRDIFAQFLTESSTLGLAGGAIGCALSAGCVAVLLTRPRHIDNSVLALAAWVWLGAFAFNVMFACLPAYRAANLDPIRCLRPA